MLLIGTLRTLRAALEALAELAASARACQDKTSYYSI